MPPLTSGILTHKREKGGGKGIERKRKTNKTKRVRFWHNMYTQGDIFFLISCQTTLCNNLSSSFKKFWSSYGNDLRFVQRWKLFTMSFYITYWKNKFFQRRLRVNTGQVEKYAIKTRKVRISAEIDILKNYFSTYNNL